jgi:hypothetical protein
VDHTYGRQKEGGTVHAERQQRGDYAPENVYCVATNWFWFVNIHSPVSWRTAFGRITVFIYGCDCNK